MAHEVNRRSVPIDVLRIELVLYATIGAAFGAWLGWASVAGLIVLLAVMWVVAVVRRYRDG